MPSPRRSGGPQGGQDEDGNDVSVLWPWGLAWLGVAGAIGVLYLFKPRQFRVEFSSLWLWERSGEEERVRSLWQWLRAPLAADLAATGRHPGRTGAGAAGGRGAAADDGPCGAAGGCLGQYARR